MFALITPSYRIEYEYLIIKGYSQLWKLTKTVGWA